VIWKENGRRSNDRSKKPDGFFGRRNLFRRTFLKYSSERLLLAAFPD